MWTRIVVGEQPSGPPGKERSGHRSASHSWSSPGHKLHAYSAIGNAGWDHSLWLIIAALAVSSLKVCRKIPKIH